MIKFKLILLLVFISTIVFGQVDENQSVELPEFVITGTQKIIIPLMKKKRPKQISSLSDEFFLPTFSPEDLSLSNFSNPLLRAKDNKIVKSYDGKLKLGLGTQTLPTGTFQFDKNVQYFLLHTKIFGLNEVDYQPYSGYNISGAEAAFTFFVSKKSKYFPGLKISLESDAYRDKYYLFASKKPSSLRETQGGNASLVFDYDLFKSFNYNLKFFGDLTNVKANNLYDQSYGATGNIGLRYSNVGVSFGGKYLINGIKSNTQKENNKHYYSVTSDISLFPFKSLSFKFGFEYAHLDTSNFYSPKAGFNLKLDEGIYMFAEYKPYSRVNTFSNFLQNNRFVNVQNHEAFMEKHQSNIKVAFKFEYEKYFEIGLGLALESIDNLSYFEDSSQQGIFDVKLVDNVNSTSLFMNLLFHPGPLGMFYADGRLQSVKDEFSNNIPYRPLVQANFSYSYSFKFGLEPVLKANYMNTIYTNISNSDKISDYINLSFGLNYRLEEKILFTLNLENLLNNNLYFYKGYVQKPLDVILGVEYRW